ncbi:MAG: hypothetical protein L6Q57_07175 [Alphaproteobacteria bacterium]|nr:hypothetical protein [Alphaproteobacteria bacterium]
MMHAWSLKITPERLLALLQDCEGFCLGDRRLTPAEFVSLNEELSMSAVMVIGTRRIKKVGPQRHLLWTSPDRQTHDLGSIETMNIMRDYPGFHPTRSLALGNNTVMETRLVPVTGSRRQATLVRMNDGSVGYGPNYRMALRNAALKMYLNKTLQRTGLLTFFARSLGFI